MTRVRAGASRRASRSETKSFGSLEAVVASSSSSRAAVIDQRRANGLRASRLMRLPAETTPTTLPPASTTGRWFTPACSISMLASGASIWALTVFTGAVMTTLTGVSDDKPPARTFLRRSVSVTMPSPLRLRTRSAVTTSSLMSVAASRTVVAGSQNTGPRRIRDVTGTLRTSGMARMAWAARMSRSRRV
jgi:hypothetical protein